MRMLQIIESNFKSSTQIISQSEQALQALFKDASVGFLALGQRRQLLESSWIQADKIKQSQDQVILIGIGGSSLGPQLIKDLYDKENQVFILDNLDPYLLDNLESWVKDLKRLHVVVVSKSGKTLETLVLASEMIKKYRTAGLALENHFTCITEPVDQDLSIFAKNHKIPVLELPVDIGGRYSILTPVGNFLFAYFNQDMKDIRLGIEEAISSRELVTQLMSLSMQSFFDQYQVTSFWTYSSKLRFFGSWLQQLWSESLGKPGAKVSTFLPLVGAIDQHSVLQQLVEGEIKNWSCLMSVKSLSRLGPIFEGPDFPSLGWARNQHIGGLLNAECLATFEGLKQSNRRVTLLELQDLSPRSISHLLMLSQIWVAGLGFALKINPFDQPGVELGKRLVKNLV